MILGSLIRGALAGALALALVLVPAGSAAGDNGDVTRSGEVVTKDVAQAPQKVIDYWTKKRMRNARPADFAPFDVDYAIADGGAELASPSAYQPDGDPVVIPGTRGSFGGGDDSYAVGGDIEANPAGGSDNTAFPLRIHGRIFATNPALGVNLSCSGTLVNSPLANLVVTAGHCVFGAGSGNAFFTNFAFVPGYYYGARPFGTYPAGTLFALSGWVAGAGFSHDVGMAQLTIPAQNTLGARGIAFNQSASQVWDHFGYPARPRPSADGFGDYDGERLIACDDATSQVLENTGTPPSIGSAYCFMQQGSSGGGWVMNALGAVNSVVSHGYCQNRNNFPNPPTGAQVWPNGPCGIFFGPYFDGTVQALYNQASSVASPFDLKAAIKKCKKKKKKKKRRKCIRRARRIAAGG